MRIWTEFETCERDHALQRPLIIPPTWQKNYDNPHLAAIWLKAEELLGDTERILFVGYSLPESDVSIRYLLKKSLFRCKYKPEIAVVTEKGKDESSEEYKRYRRLFGRISFESIGFEKLAEDPTMYL